MALLNVEFTLLRFPQNNLKKHFAINGPWLSLRYYNERRWEKPEKVSEILHSLLFLFFNYYFFPWQKILKMWSFNFFLMVKERITVCLIYYWTATHRLLFSLFSYKLQSYKIGVCQNPVTRCNVLRSQVPGIGQE